VTVNVGSEAKTLTLDADNLKKFEALKTKDAKADFVKNLAVKNNLGKAEDITVDTKSGGWNKALNWWKPDVQGFGTTSSRRLKTDNDLNWFSRRAQKRYLHFNPSERPAVNATPSNIDAKAIAAASPYPRQPLALPPASKESIASAALKN